MCKKCNGNCRKASSVVIAGLNTGVGKTTFTLGLLELLRGKQLVSFKIGPDYIDPIYHEVVVGRRSPSLDGFFLDRGGLMKHFSEWAWGNEYVVVEGVMGLLDGLMEGVASTDEVSSVLHLPVVLLVESIPSVQTLAAMVKGVIDSANSDIIGIVFTKVKSYRLFKKQRDAIRSLTGLQVLGSLPFDSRMKIPSRHLGLDTDFSDVKGVASLSAKLVRENCDVDRFFRCVNVDHFDTEVVKPVGKVAVSRDEAFLFLYPENLRWFESKGYEIEFFSPLHDDFPPDADLYYLTGGYPELYAESLSRNTTMLSAIRDVAESGVPIIAECGGFMYLMESIEGKRMVGFIRGAAFMSDRLQGFGYRNARVLNNTPFAVGTRLKAHEFHYSKVYLEESQNAMEVRIPFSDEVYVTGISKKGVLASYLHFYFPSEERGEL